MPKISPAFAIALVLLVPTIGAATMVKFGDGVSPTTPQFQAAVNMYGTGVTNVYPAQDDAFAAAFPNYQLYVVEDGTTWGNAYHTFAWNPTTSNAFDVTRNYNGLLNDALAVITSSGDAIKYAKAYAQTANAELQLSRKVLNASDSTLLNRTVISPTSTSTGLLAYSVKLGTWTRDNGILANWTLNFSSNKIRIAQWEVKGTYTGPFFIDPKGILFQVGHLITIDFTGSNGNGNVGSGIKNADGTISNVASIYAMNPTSMNGDLPTPPPITRYNADGTRWEIVLPTNAPSLPAQRYQELQAWAEALANGSQNVYAKMVSTDTVQGVPGYCAGNPADAQGTPSTGSNPAQNWGFTTSDADCAFQIVIGEPNALVQCGQPHTDPVTSAEGRNESIFITADLDLCRQMLNATAGNNEVYVGTSDYDVARTMIAHELYHILQFDAGLGTAPALWTEGQAVFAATVAATDVEQQSNSLYKFWQKGYVAHLDKGICWFDTPHVDSNPLLAYYDYQMGGAPIAYQTALASVLRMNNSGYQFAPFWGYLYSQAAPGHEWELMRRLAHANPPPSVEGDCSPLVGDILAATRADPGPLSSMDMLGLLEDMTLKVLKPDLTWAGQQWSEGTPGLSVPTLEPGQALEYWGHGWGTRLIKLAAPTGTPIGIRCDYRGTLEGDWSARLVIVNDLGASNLATVTCRGAGTQAQLTYQSGAQSIQTGDSLYFANIRTTDTDNQFWVELDN